MLLYNEQERRDKPRYFFLFNDVLLVVKREGHKRLWLRVYFSLGSDIRVMDVSDRQPNVEFQISAPSHTFVFHCRTLALKDSWVRVIRAAADACTSQCSSQEMSHVKSRTATADSAPLGNEHLPTMASRSTESTTLQPPQHGIFAPLIPDLLSFDPISTQSSSSQSRYSSISDCGISEDISPASTSPFQTGTEDLIKFS